VECARQIVVDTVALDGLKTVKVKESVCLSAIFFGPSYTVYKWLECEEEQRIADLLKSLEKETLT
jgi:hypothetical protein